MAYEVNEGGLPAPSSQPLLKGMKGVIALKFGRNLYEVRVNSQSGPNIGQIEGKAALGVMILVY